MTEKKAGKWDFALSMLFGGVSGCTATCVVQPIDTIKVRIQIVSEERGMKLAGKAAQRSTNPFDVAKEMYTQDGIFGFWRGIGAGMLRQMTYCTIRMGLYKYLYDEFKAKYNRNLKLWEKASLSLLTGLIGSWFGNPADIVLVRFQVDSMLPAEKRRNYTGLTNALVRIVKEEGLTTLWRGSYPTVVRAMAMNMGMLTTYDQVKETIVKYTQDENSYSTKFISSTIAGFVCAFMSLPPDNIKTKLMKMKKQEDGTMPYTGVADCFKKTIQREGISKLWVGYSTFVVRVAPHAIIALLVQDALHNLFIAKH